MKLLQDLVMNMALDHITEQDKRIKKLKKQLKIKQETIINLQVFVASSQETEELVDSKLKEIHQSAMALRTLLASFSKDKIKEILAKDEVGAAAIYEAMFEILLRDGKLIADLLDKIEKSSNTEEWNNDTSNCNTVTDDQKG